MEELCTYLDPKGERSGAIVLQSNHQLRWKRVRKLSCTDSARGASPACKAWVEMAMDRILHFLQAPLIARPRSFSPDEGGVAVAGDGSI